MTVSSHMELRCLNCSFTTHCGPAEMVSWLEQSGMARRTRGLKPELLAELFQSASGSFRCPACNSPGMEARPADDEMSDEDWGMARACDSCRRPIAPERLEILPDTRLCAACAGGASVQQDEPEYCPHCGAIMKLSQSRSGPVARYVMRCPDCGQTL